MTHQNDILSLEEHVRNSELSKPVILANDTRTFFYALDKNAAKNKLVKGANRAPFDIKHNSSSTNLIFSPGSWQNVVIPSLFYWKEVAGEQSCKVGDYTIKIGSVKSGRDAIGNNIDHKIVFFADRDKVVCHAYNTTQLILVNGHGYRKLIDLFLKPFFQSKIEYCLPDIKAYNTKVLEKLGTKMVKRSNVAYKGGSCFSCNQCDFSSKNLSSLNKHKNLVHVVNLSISSTLSLFKQSTRNNTATDENMMLEDVSIENISNNDAITLEEESVKEKEFTPDIKCDWLPCNFKSKDKNILMKHIDIHIGNKAKTHSKNLEIVDLVSCDQCEMDFATNIELVNHKKKKHSVIPTSHKSNVEEGVPDSMSMCISCSKSFTTQDERKNHMPCHDQQASESETELADLEELTNLAHMTILEMYAGEMQKDEMKYQCDKCHVM